MITAKHCESEWECACMCMLGRHYINYSCNIVLILPHNRSKHAYTHTHRQTERERETARERDSEWARERESMLEIGRES